MKLLGAQEKGFEWMERFVHTFQTRWDELIAWCQKDGRAGKALEWMCFAAVHGDQKQALEAARYVSPF
jgi:hypothetical protein